MSDKVKEANDLLHASNNKVARGLLGRISTLTALGEANDLFYSIRKAKESNAITDDEHEAIMTLFSHIVTTGNLEPT